MLEDIHGFLRHLVLRNPKGGFGDGHREIVDFDAVEMVNVNTDDLVKINAPSLLTVSGQTQCIIF